jgi:O-antigen/teichoic acid export membrane protein
MDLRSSTTTRGADTVDKSPMKPFSASHVIRNTSVSTLARIATLIIGFLLTPLILSNLGVEKFGVYAVIGSLQAYFGVLDLGIGGGLTRYMVYHGERGEDQEVRGITTFGILFYLALAVAMLPLIAWVASIGAALIGAPATQLATIPALVMMMFGLFIYNSIVGVFSARLAADHRLDLVAVSGAVGTLVFAALVIAFSHRYPTVEFLFICSTAQTTVGLAIVYFCLRRLDKVILSSPRSISRSRVKELFSFGLWTQINGISSLINLEADKIIISRSLGVAAVTPYHMANRLALMNRLLPLQLLSSLLPHITAHVSRGVTDAELNTIYRRDTRSLMLATLLISGLTVGAVSPLLTVWLGRDLPGAAAICVALVISYAINNLTGVSTTILRAEGQPKYESYYAILSASLNVVLTIAFIRSFGMFGVVLGTIIGNCIGSTCFIVLFHRLKRLGWWESMGEWLSRLTLATAFASLSTHLFLDWMTPRIGENRLELIVALVCASVVYIVVFAIGATLLGYWDHADKAIFQKIWIRAQGRLAS